MNYDYMYKGRKNSTQMQTGYEKYTPGTVGKIAIAITVPSALISFITVMIALFGPVQILVVTFFTFLIAFLGSIVIMVDIVLFNRKQKKITGNKQESKPLDIMRIVHLLIGVLVGVIIGYLIWGAKYH